MIGPSSSHTAGAARLGRVARLIAGEPIASVSFGLHGSFAKTYKGHGTDKALVAGVLGIKEDDERIARSFEIAKEEGLEYSFYPTQLESQHENTVLLTFNMKDGKELRVIGSSIGGGQILITKIGEFSVELTAQSPAIVFEHRDRPGVIGAVSNLLAENNINIASMKLSRRAKGDIAFCVIETDNFIPENAIEAINQMPNIIHVEALNIGLEVDHEL